MTIKRVSFGGNGSLLRSITPKSNDMNLFTSKPQGKGGWATKINSGQGISMCTSGVLLYFRWFLKVVIQSEHFMSKSANAGIRVQVFPNRVVTAT